MTRKVLARKAGVGLKRLGLYEWHALLRGANDTADASGYAEGDVQTVRHIKRAQALGFSLEEIRVLLALRDGETDGCRFVEERALQWIYKIDDRIGLLLAVRGKLERLIEEVEA